MRGYLAQLRRVAIAAVIVVTCSAVSCELQPRGEIQYAPGYGYVVLVEQYSTGFQSEKSYYQVFPTLERAQEFRDSFLAGRRDTPPVREDERRFDTNSPDGQTIWQTLQPVPPRTDEIELPLSSPELPQPIPQTPQ